jgi:O-antigen/teichoic acid export membrane protein
MRPSLNSLIFIVVGLLIVGGGFAYGTARLGLSTFLVLSGLAVALGVVAVIFLRKMTHPDRTVEQMLYKTDHPKNT